MFRELAQTAGTWKKNDVYEKCPGRMCVATSSLSFEWFVQGPGECLVAQLLEHNVILGARVRNIAFVTSAIFLCQKSDCWLFWSVWSGFSRWKFLWIPKVQEAIELIYPATQLWESSLVWIPFIQSSTEDCPEITKSLSTALQIPLPTIHYQIVCLQMKEIRSSF